jgi:hypothetical protein
MYARGRRPRHNQSVSKGTGSEAEDQGITWPSIDTMSSDSAIVQ